MSLPNRPPEALVSHSRLLEVVIYRPEYGVFVSRTCINGRRAGRIMGCIHHSGYVVVWVDGKAYQASRLAWFYMTGEWPPNFVDHEDRDKSNNKWDNLRLANDSQNRRNSTMHYSNSSGRKGVSLRQRGSWKPVWTAQINFDGQKIHLGDFGSCEEAAEAYKSAAIKYYGEYAGGF